MALIDMNLVTLKARAVVQQTGLFADEQPIRWKQKNAFAYLES
jgi:hypothetical protein